MGRRGGWATHSPAAGGGDSATPGSARLGPGAVRPASPPSPRVAPGALGGAQAALRPAPRRAARGGMAGGRRGFPPTPRRFPCGGLLLVSVLARSLALSFLFIYFLALVLAGGPRAAAHPCDCVVVSRRL